MPKYDFKYFLTEKRDGVLHVTLNRPERRNAISPEMHEEMAPLFATIASDRDTDVVLVTGAGNKAFCVGADFAGMQDNLDAGGYEDGHPDLFLGSTAIVRGQLAVPQPMIAAINGDALGLGATLALFCDVVLMADHARIGDPHVGAGLVAGDGGAILWPLLMGVNRAKEYLMTGDLMDAPTAERLGVVNHVYPGASLMDEATKLAQRLAAGPSIAIQFNKRLANAEVRDRVERLLDTSLAMEAVTFETEDHREAVRAFLEKRRPQFGRARRS
jgi:enoyl-CoA hydratase